MTALTVNYKANFIGGVIEKEITNLLMDAEDNVDRISETIDLDYYYFQNNDKEKSQMLNYQTNRNNERNESSESKISSKESEFCSFKQSLSRIGLVLDLYLRNREYWFIKRIIKKATLDDFIALCKYLFLIENVAKKSRKAQKSNIISQYIIQLVDFYLNDLEQREGAQKEDDQKVHTHHSEFLFLLDFRLFFKNNTLL